MLLGGVMSAWTDLWTDPWECMGGAPPGTGGPLFPPSADEYFYRSLGGMLFPRGLVGASSFWNFDASLDSQSPDFVAAVWALNDRLVAAGAFTCPTRCDCGLLMACDVPYLPLPPPAVNMSLATAACALPLPPMQAFRLLPSNGSGSGSSSGSGSGGGSGGGGGGRDVGPAVVVATVGAAGQLLCAAYAPGGGGAGGVFGALVLAPCESAGTVRFSPRDSESGIGALVVLDSLEPPNEPACLDAGAGGGPNGTVSASECGGHQGEVLLSQGWAIDDVAKVFVSFAGGGCLTAA